MYEIQVNGETVWDSGDNSKMLVTEISVQTPRGEVAFLRVPPGEAVLNLSIQARSMESRPLDLMDEMKRRVNEEVSKALEEEFGTGFAVETEVESATDFNLTPEPEESVFS